MGILPRVGKALKQLLSLEKKKRQDTREVMPGPAHQYRRGRALTAGIPVTPRVPGRPAAAAPPPAVRRAAAPAPAARPGAAAAARRRLGRSRPSGSPPPAACGTAPLPRVPAPPGAALGSAAAPCPPVEVLPELLGQRLLQPLPLRRRRPGALRRCAAATAARHVPAATPRPAR